MGLLALAFAYIEVFRPKWLQSGHPDVYICRKLKTETMVIACHDADTCNTVSGVMAVSMCYTECVQSFKLKNFKQDILFVISNGCVKLCPLSVLQFVVSGWLFDCSVTVVALFAFNASIKCCKTRGITKSIV